MTAQVAAPQDVEAGSPLMAASSTIVMNASCHKVSFKSYSRSMTTATALWTSLLCACICATGSEKAAPPVFVCNLKAISAAERPRYQDLVQRIRSAVRNRNEISNGYVFTVDSKTVTLPEAAEWVSMERLCCPFLTLQLTASGNRANWLLTLTGPLGVKQLITAEFPSR